LGAEGAVLDLTSHGAGYAALAIFVPGLLWLGVLFGWDNPILAWGLTPFLLGGLAKSTLAVIAMPCVWKILRRD
jgi:biotin transport system substrate-specific component